MLGDTAVKKLETAARLAIIEHPEISFVGLEFNDGMRKTSAVFLREEDNGFAYDLYIPFHNSTVEHQSRDAIVKELMRQIKGANDDLESGN